MTDPVARMRADLTAAMRAREQGVVRVLRSTLAAVANAEAHPVDHSAPSSSGGGRIAGAVAGLGAAEVDRRELSPADVRAIIEAERDERLRGAADLEQRGAAEHADSLRADAGVLERYLAT
ncbi:MAG: hypothetical protein U0R80_07100 [Nocardioidaceae bacterium]